LKNDITNIVYLWNTVNEYIENSDRLQGIFLDTIHLIHHRNELIVIHYSLYRLEKSRRRRQKSFEWVGHRAYCGPHVHAQWPHSRRRDVAWGVEDHGGAGDQHCSRQTWAVS